MERYVILVDIQFWGEDNYVGRLFDRYFSLTNGLG